MNPARDGHLVKAGGRMPYIVTIAGCDDITAITVDLDDDEAAAIRRVAAALTAQSEYECQPTLSIERASQ
jgi:ribosomal protein S5